AVFVEIGCDGRHTIAFAQFRDASLFAHLGECSVSVVVIERVITGWQAARAALDRDSLPIAIAICARLGDMLEIELKIIGDEQIEVAVAVVVDEGAAGAPARNITEQTSLFGYVSKSAIAIVAIKFVLPEVRNEEIFEAVVVIVADAHAACPAD